MSSRRRSTVDPTIQLQLALDAADAPSDARPRGVPSVRARAGKRPIRKATTTSDAETTAAAPARRSTQRPSQPAPRFLLTGGPASPDSDQRRIPQAQLSDRTPESALLFAEDVATMVGMTRKWVYTETRAGRIPHVALVVTTVTVANRSTRGYARPSNAGRRGSHARSRTRERSGCCEFATGLLACETSIQRNRLRRRSSAPSERAFASRAVAATGASSTALVAKAPSARRSRSTERRRAPTTRPSESTGSSLAAPTRRHERLHLHAPLPQSRS